MIAMGGYDIGQVDKLLALVDETQEPGDGAGYQKKAEALRSASNQRFPVRFRGYAKMEVDRYVARRLRELAGYSPP